jgi:NAD(P)-dependent dehydrogenase (short-subunit alcohol dehydrogenase family)
MEQILITGGTDGIGKGLAMMYADRGAVVYVVGHSKEKGDALESYKAQGSIRFIQADLSLVSENIRVAEYMKSQTDHLDKLILCAASLRAQSEYRETAEDVEFTFALYYLSRYVLSYALSSLLTASHDPIVINVAAPGMKTKLYADDFQMKNNYNGQQAQFHGSRLNDLLGVSFSEKFGESIKYMLFNPMAARTPGAAKMSRNSLIMKAYYRLFGKDVEELTEIINEDASSLTKGGLSAFKLKKPVNLSMGTFHPVNAAKLNDYSVSLLKSMKNIEY